MTTRIARIAWLAPEQGDRQHPPPGPRYSTLVRFAERGDPTSEWSLVVDLVSRPASSADWIANVRFLADGAPQHWLTDGARFELYEGKKRVAVGTILAEAG